MFCNNCGAEINDQAVICPKCGVQIAKNSNLGVKETPPNSVGALICAILSWVLFAIIPFVGLVFATVGFNLSISGRSKAAKDPARYGSTTMLTVAMVFSLIAIVGALVSLVFMIVANFRILNF